MEAGAGSLKIGVDLDGTISEYPQFFKVFTKAMAEAGCKVYVITDRMPGTERSVAAELEQYGMTYDTIKITSDKAGFILAEGISVLFDDMNRYFAELPEEVAVFKVRQKYNFDFRRMMWKD
ncbi:MAG: hypothetical protein ACYTEL_25670 [Planctomycetota bacterium]|jgi:hypothetical protein